MVKCGRKEVSVLKDFEDFRNNVLTAEKEQELITRSLETATPQLVKNQESYLATFSATFSVLLLAEYHEWLNGQC